MWIASESNKLGVVEELLRRKDIDVNKTDNEGRTPLWIASESNKLGVVEELLRRKDIDVNKTDNEGRTPLWIASENGRCKVVQKILLDDHVNINRADNKGHTPLWVTERIYSKIIGWLLKFSHITLEIIHSTKEEQDPFIRFHAYDMIRTRRRAKPYSENSTTEQCETEQCRTEREEEYRRMEIYSRYCIIEKCEREREEEYKKTELYFREEKYKIHMKELLHYAFAVNVHSTRELCRTPIMEGLHGKVMEELYMEEREYYKLIKLLYDAHNNN